MQFTSVTHFSILYAGLGSQAEVTFIGAVSLSNSLSSWSEDTVADATCTNGAALDIISITENISESSEYSLFFLIQWQVDKMVIPTRFAIFFLIYSLPDFFLKNLNIYLELNSKKSTFIEKII